MALGKHMPRTPPRPPPGNCVSQSEAVAVGHPKSLALRRPFTLTCRSGQKAAPLLGGHAVLELHDLRKDTSLLTPARHRTPPTPDQQPPGKARGPEGFPGHPSDRECERACVWGLVGGLRGAGVLVHSHPQPLQAWLRSLSRACPRSVSLIRATRP